MSKHTIGRCPICNSPISLTRTQWRSAVRTSPKGEVRSNGVLVNIEIPVHCRNGHVATEAEGGLA